MKVLHEPWKNSSYCVWYCVFQIVKLEVRTDYCGVALAYKSPLTSIWFLWFSICLKQHSAKNTLIGDLDIHLETFSGS